MNYKNLVFFTLSFFIAFTGYSQEAKDLLMSNSSQLIEKRGFGSPTFFYRDHMFFGNDRLHLLEECIIKDLI